MTIKIGLDAGHGLKTAGKQTPDGIKEWTLNDKVRNKVVELLADYECEFIYLDNNEGEIDESLANRLKKYQDANVNACVSIHHNAFTGSWNNATGVGVFTDKNATAEDMKLAEAINSRLTKYTGLKNRGIKHENFYVINQNKIPAVLVEGGFMDSTVDYPIITSNEGQTAYAKAVAEGLIEFLKLKKKATQKNSTEDVAQKLVDELKNKGYNCIEVLEKAIAIVTNTSSTNVSIKYFKKYTGNTSSIIAALKTINEESSFKYRTTIAKVNNITNYTGTAAQNGTMLKLLKSGTLIKP